MKRQISRRLPRWSEIFVYAAVGFGPLSIARLSVAQAAPARFAIETSQVIDAMRCGALPVEGAQVRLAAPVTSSVPGARIEVASMTPVGPHQVRLRLACSERSQCLPFFATAIYSDGVDVSALHYNRGANSANGANQPVNTSAAKDAEMLHAGSKATLEFESDRIHVRLEVISLQNGLPGNRIRVSSIDHKQIYTAEVITPALLKGELSN